MDNVISTSVAEQALQRLGAHVDAATAVRQMMITKVSEEVNKVELNANGSSGAVLEAKLGLFKLLDDLLKSDVADSTALLKALMLKQDTESTVNAREMAIAVLREVGVLDIPKNRPFIQQEVAADALEVALVEAQDKNPDLKLTLTEGELTI